MLMLDDGKISKNDEMKKLPFVMVRLLTVGSDQVINSFQEVYNSINLVFDSESEDVVELSDEERQNIMTKLSSFANTCRVDLGVSDEEEDTHGTYKLRIQLSCHCQIIGVVDPKS